MYSNKKDLSENKIFTTKERPIYFYLIVALWAILLIVFLIVLKIRNPDKDGIINAATLLFFIAIYLYLLFGRYLATISMSEDKIQVKYLFTWNKEIEFKFERLKEIDFKEYDLVNRLTHSWYRGGKWLYLKNETDKVCQFKYSINDSDNKKLLVELQKRCSKKIAYT